MSERARRRLSDYLGSVRPRGAMADGVTDALREAILDGLLPASSWLREEDLAAELEVSRTPVREALRRLTAEGLAVRAPNQGVQVAPMAIEDILAVYAVRENLEGLAARLAARRCGDELAASLRDAQRRFEAAGAADDITAMISLNLEFHRIIRQATGNQYLERFLTLVEHAVRRFGGTTFETPQRRAETVREHGRIVDAIVEARPDDAEKLAMEHMRRARDARIQSFLESNALGRLGPQSSDAS